MFKLKVFLTRMLFDIYPELPEALQRPILGLAIDRAYACPLFRQGIPSDAWMLAWNLADYSHHDLCDYGFDMLG